LLALPSTVVLETLAMSGFGRGAEGEVGARQLGDRGEASAPRTKTMAVKTRLEELVNVAYF